MILYVGDKPKFLEAKEPENVKNFCAVVAKNIVAELYVVKKGDISYFNYYSFNINLILNKSGIIKTVYDLYLHISKYTFVVPLFKTNKSKYKKNIKRIKIRLV